MKKALQIDGLGVLTVVVLVVVGLYVSTQEPRFWCDSRWAGVALNRGGYRSLSVTLQDVVHFSGDQHHVYWPPRLCYTDLRGKHESMDLFLTNGPMRWGPLPGNDSPANH